MEFSNESSRVVSFFFSLSWREREKIVDSEEGNVLCSGCDSDVFICGSGPSEELLLLPFESLRINFLNFHRKFLFIFMFSLWLLHSKNLQYQQLHNNEKSKLVFLFIFMPISYSYPIFENLISYLISNLLKELLCCLRIIHFSFLIITRRHF